MFINLIACWNVKKWKFVSWIWSNQKHVLKYFHECCFWSWCHEGNDWEPRLGNCRHLHLAHLSVLIRKRDCEQQCWFSLAVISQHPGHREVQVINKGINYILSQTLTSGLNCKMETKFKDHGQTHIWLIISWFWVLVL